MGNTSKGVLIEDKSQDEITMQILTSDLLKMYQMLRHLNIDIVATTQHVTFLEKYSFIWINDTGNRLTNAIKSGLLSADVKFIKKSKGLRKICTPSMISSLSFRNYIATLEGCKVISHTVTHLPVAQCVYF